MSASCSIAPIPEVGQLRDVSLRSLVDSPPRFNCDNDNRYIQLLPANPFSDRDIILTSCSRLPKLIPLAFISCK